MKTQRKRFYAVVEGGNIAYAVSTFRKAVKLLPGQGFFSVVKTSKPLPQDSAIRFGQGNPAQLADYI